MLMINISSLMLSDISFLFTLVTEALGTYLL